MYKHPSLQYMYAVEHIYNDYLSPGFSDQKDSQDAGEPRELNTEEEDDEEMSAEKDKK